MTRKLTRAGQKNHMVRSRVFSLKPLGNSLRIGFLAFASSLPCLLAGCAAEATKVDTVAQAPSAEYHIGPGDTLNIVVWNHADLSLTIPVRPDGFISTPLVENVQAAGKTPSQLAQDIQTRLSEYVRTPQVNVIVMNFVGLFSDQIRVVGQASKPQSLPFRANMTLLDVLIQVGGLAEFAAGNRAKLIRVVDGKQQKIGVRLNDLLKGDVRANMPVRPGDVLIIPESRF
jgi:polysaccharide export outer membrane protein